MKIVCHFGIKRSASFLLPIDGAKYTFKNPCPMIQLFRCFTVFTSDPGHRGK